MNVPQIKVEWDRMMSAAVMEPSREFWRYLFAGLALLVTERSANHGFMDPAHAVQQADALLAELEKP